MLCANINVLAGCILSFGAMGAPVEVSKEVLLPHNLVQAKVTKVVFGEGRYDAFFEVTHVYKGDADLFRGRFVIWACTSGESLQGLPSFIPPLKVGDSVIWLLRREGDTLEHVPFGIRTKRTRTGLPIPLPAREGEDDPGFPYSDVLAFAKTVEKTVNAPPHQRYALLEDFALSETPTVATWAMFALPEADPKRAADFLRQLLLRPEPTVVHKVLADRVLSALDETGWRTSQDRLALYRKWVAAPLPEDAAESLVASLNLMLQPPPFPVETVVQLFESAIRNENLATKSRARATSRLLLVRRYPEQRKRVFDLMVHLLIHTDIPEIELQAVRVLRHALHEEVQQHRDRVLGALPSVQNETAAMLLQEALADKPVDLGSDRQ